MASKQSKSKKPSGGKADQSGQPEKFTFFLDENHCNNQHLLRTFNEAGEDVVRHLDHFDRGTADEVWLPFIGERGWILITTDKRIRYHTLEKQGVVDNNVAMFVFTSNNLSGSAMAEILAKALPDIRAKLRHNERPLIASISKSGLVTILETASGSSK